MRSDTSEAVAKVVVGSGCLVVILAAKLAAVAVVVYVAVVVLRACGVLT